jgi:hypothetical protein
VADIKIFAAARRAVSQVLFIIKRPVPVQVHSMTLRYIVGPDHGWRISGVHLHREQALPLRVTQIDAHNVFCLFLSKMTTIIQPNAVKA